MPAALCVIASLLIALGRFSRQQGSFLLLLGLFSQLSLEAVPAAVCVQMTFATALNLSHNRLTNLKYQGSDEMTLVDDAAMAPLADVIGAPIQVPDGSL